MCISYSSVSIQAVTVLETIAVIEISGLEELVLKQIKLGNFYDEPTVETPKRLTRDDVIKVLLQTPYDTQKTQQLRFQGTVTSIILYHSRNITWSRHFSGVNLSGCDLSYLDLRNINFKYANLSHTNLKSANLSDSILDRADLSNAVLDVNLQISFRSTPVTVFF